MECSIAEYYEMLKAHDWFYENADDQTVWKNGRDSYLYLSEIAETKKADYQRMFEAFNASMFSGEPWGTEKVPLPRINEYL